MEILSLPERLHLPNSAALLGEGDWKFDSMGHFTNMALTLYNNYCICSIEGEKIDVVRGEHI